MRVAQPVGDAGGERGAVDELVDRLRRERLGLLGAAVAAEPDEEVFVVAQAAPNSRLA